jgi:hypothetical protein
MMKKAFLYLLLCGIAFGEQSVEEVSQSLLNDFEKRANAGVLAPEEMKADIIKYVRDVRDGKIYGNHVSARILLVNLNDEEYIQSLLQDLQGEHPRNYTRAMDILTRSSQIRVIPLVIEFAYADDDMWKGFKGNYDLIPSLSHVGGYSCISILSRSPEIPNEVREWARAVLERPLSEATPDSRELIRQWWPQNKRYFETREYHKLRPLGAEHPPEELSVSAAPAEPEASPPTADPVTATESAAGTKSERFNDLGQERQAEQPSISWELLLSIMIIPAIAVVVLFRWRRK